MSQFVHLHVHSHYSLLDGLGQIDELIKIAKQYEMPAMALTDHGVMYGAIEFYKKAKKAGIKPIIGVEAYVARNGHLNKRPKIDERPWHLILLAKDKIGYHNLVKLTTIAHLQGFYYKPRIDWELLQEHHEGLIALTACVAGELPGYILNNDLKSAREMIARYQDLLGRENFFLEAQYHPNFDKQNKLNEQIYRLAEETGAAVVATNDVHYPRQEDEYAQDALLCIQTKKTLSDQDRMSYIGFDLSFKSQERMIADFADHPEVIANTLKVAEMCNLELQLGDNILPNFPLPEGQTADDYLRELCEQGLRERFKPEQITPEIRERLSYELSVIAKTGYAGYFLIVSDFINWAKDGNIVVGPGRGSAAGSLVSYLTQITNIDPVKYDLVFERFLNPERISMPDIDTDFADSRRDEVLSYVADKYGRDHVAQIITFGTMAARNAIRDVGRVMSLPYNYCDRVAKLIPMGMNLTEACEAVPEMKDILNDSDGAKLIATAKRLEGVCRHASTHACGVVITPESLDYYAPRQYGSGESIVVQYEGHSVEDLGLLKMDFLGLSNLTIIEQALRIIKKIHNIDIDVDSIPLDDKKSYKLFQEGKTTGVFQFESAGMKRYLKQLAPTDLEDLIAMVALYRPGPMEYIPDYINGKHGRKKPQYLHPKLEPILKGTYGVAVYQEQLLRIARDLAGFTYGEADVLRKAVGKKIKELLHEQEIKMVDGMVKNNIDRRVAEKIWEFILPFAAYGFNRSHAACYALIAYQTAYLKANYPAEFMAALLTSDQQNLDRIAIEVDECRQLGIEVLPPDINESFADFGVVAQTLATAKPRVRFGLMAVKGLGENIVKEIIAERKANGRYSDLVDFLSRVKSKDLNKRSLEALIKAGASDSLSERNLLLQNMERLLKFIQEATRSTDEKQDSLFDLSPQVALPRLKLEPAPPLDKKTKLLWEKESLGLYISEHPMSDYAAVTSNYAAACATLRGCVDGVQVRVAGVITNVKKIYTKKGDAMLFVKVEDTSGEIEILVFPKILEQNPHLWQPDTIIIASGTVSDKDGERKILCDLAAILNQEGLKETLDNFLVSSRDQPSRGRRQWGNGNGYDNSRQSAVSVSAPKTIEKIITFNLNPPLDYDLTKQLKALIFAYPGNHIIELMISNTAGKEKIRTNFRVNYSESFKQAAEKLLGPGTVVA
ncbi:MAG: DNA polymerase III subunit alpha [Patescibacteria group bacterium]|jgi:DNA polymerase-3 subunit alpha